MKRIAGLAAAFGLLALLGISCRKEPGPYEGTYEQVLVMCSLGYNNLSYDLAKDIDEFCSGELPDISSDRTVVAFCHHRKSGGAESRPCLVHLYSKNGVTVRDTIKVYDASDISASAPMLTRALTDIHHRFDSRHYGMIFSSHGTGWIPEGYSFRNESGSSVSAPRWIGQQSGPGAGKAYYIDIRDFASAIPYKFDYIIMDTCFMGCVEVLYELKDVCRYLAVSPAEILADGMPYSLMAGSLLSGPSPDVQKVCKSYFDYYNAKSSSIRSATISLMDCSRTGPLTECCAALVRKYSEAFFTLGRTAVQRYYPVNSPNPYFHDLYDIFARAGASSAELAELDAALSECIIYHAETEMLLNDIHTPLENCCGLSMYLPNPSWPKLNDYYSTLGWSRATALVP